MNADDDKSVGSALTRQVDGISQIFVKDIDGQKMNHPCSLHYYNGFIKLGNKIENLESIDVTVLGFIDTEIGKIHYDNLANFDHPGIIEAFAYGVGKGQHSNNSFLAVTKFETTFEGYLRRDGLLATDQQNRFTESFINLLRDVIVAMEELHRQGYYCAKFHGSHFAIINEGGSQRARLWRFGKIKGDTEAAISESKANDWVRLGYKIENVSLAPESKDLFKRIIDRKLQGEKFENILSLNQYIALHLKEPQMEREHLIVSNLSLQTLEENLDKIHVWNMLSFVQLTRVRKTLRGFIYSLRTIIEHEVQFLTPELLAEGIFKDLEHYFQHEWKLLYQKVQEIAMELNLKY
uniref:Protein kinase domain-containing protein n=1 Tax=Aegilops tauschii subsp. strangulata TaxID=200361 RepID=A0A453GCU6_AEGTS